MNQKMMTKTSYLIGIIFWLSAIIYFFAANWGGLDRYEKIILIVILMILFYGLSFVFSKWKQHQQDVGAWIFWGGSIAFGVAVALLGQVYNSHADSYTLFLIWLIPSALLAVFTRYPIFFIQSYILLNLTVYSYFFPINSWLPRNDTEDTMIILGIILLNLACLYGFITKGPKLISYLSGIWIQYLAIELVTGWTIIYLFNDDQEFSFMGIIAYLAITFISAWILYDYTKIRKNKVISVIASLGISINLIIQFLLVATWINGFLVYFAGLFLAIALVVMGSKWLGKLTAAKKTDESNFLPMLVKLVFVFLAVLLVSISLIGILFLMGLEEYITWAMVVFVILVPIGSHITREDSIRRYTVMLSGGIISSSILWDHSSIVLFIYLLLVGYTTWRERESSVYPFGLGGIFFAIALLCNKLIPDVPADLVIILMILLSVGLYILWNNRYTKGWNLVAILTLWLILTFYSEQTILYYFYNFSYLCFLIYFTFRVVHKKNHWLENAVFLYLIGYLGYKYYDLFWTLLHKSITFAIVGIVFLGIAIYMDRKVDSSRGNGRSEFVLGKFRKWVPIVLLQVVLLVLIIFQKETTLRNGTDIVLKIEPIDPRSLLQGDYVDLSYNISQVDSYDLPDRVYVLLEQDQEGIYQIKEIYDTIEEANDDKSKDTQVVITGKTYGNTIRYGIENFFIEEGTGAKVEQNANYAKIKVGSNGDALLMSVSSELTENE